MLEKPWSTTNLGLAAYLLARGKDQGIRLDNVVKVKPHNLTGTFIIAGASEKIEKLVLEYQDSPEKEFDDKIRYLKTLCKQGLVNKD